MFDNRRFLVRSYKLFDLLVMIFSFTLATWITFHDQAQIFSFSDFLAMRIKVQNFVMFIGLILGWQFIFSAFALYHSKRLSSRKKEIIDFMEKKGDLVKEDAKKIRSQLASEGLRSFGAKKEKDHYFKTG